MENSEVIFKINGEHRSARVKPYDLLSRILREELGLIGTKRGCDYGGCGACTVSIDGRAVYSCMYPATYAENREIVTVEGLSDGGNTHPSFDSLSSIQKAFLLGGGYQCGYCTSGIMISVKCLLEKNDHPTLPEIQEALAGNICRCTGYGKVIESILAAAEMAKQAPRLVR